VPVIKASSLRDLKNRVNLHDVVVRVVALKKAGGARFKGLCPFHSEKTPSFNVSTDKGYYKCFGCGKAGDVINFVMETEGLQFTEAVEAIAQRFAITLEYEEGSGGPSKETRSLRQEIFEIHDLAADHYRQAFLAKTPHGEFIRHYWEQNRRFTAELGEEFKIGFAPPEDSGLAATLLKRKFTEDALRQCGLFFTRDGAVLTLGALRPRFRGRLMIPIRDHQGRVVAFTARQLELTPADDPAREAKYVNSPETPIFIKSNLLFNLDRARTSVGDGHPFVLVEGQLDALRCWSVGLKTAIAPQGTSITEGQLALLRRYHPQVECFFDSDSAGQKAALRFLPMALKAGLEVRFLMLAGAEKIDPDLLFLERGLAAYAEVKKDSVSGMEFISQFMLPDPREASSEKVNQVTNQIFEVIAACESDLLRRQLLGEIAPAMGKLNVFPETLVQDFNAFMARRTGTRAEIGKLIGGRDFRADQYSKGTEAHLLFLIVHHESLLHALASQLPHEWIDQSHTAGRLLDRFLAEAAHNGWPGVGQIDQLLETQEEKALIASLLFETASDDDLIKMASEGLRSLQRRFLEPKLRQIELEIASKGTNGDSDLLSLLKQRAEITRQLFNPPKLTLPA
jgi:DNA primase